MIITAVAMFVLLINNFIYEYTETIIKEDGQVRESSRMIILIQKYHVLVHI